MNIKPVLSALLIGAIVMQPVTAEASAAKDSAGQSYRGEGMCIAVIDSGFDLTHDVFVLTNQNPTLTKETVDNRMSELSMGDTAKSSYVNEKIPFAYDYAGNDTDVSGANVHGTAMLSLIAGNGGMMEDASAAVWGSAPEAQLLAMKVASDETGSVLDEDIIDAVNDAVTLGADVILMPSGDLSGYGASDDSPLSDAIRAASDAGVIIVSAAGDVLEIGTQSVYDEEYGMSRATSDSPDVGTIAYPGSLPEVLTVGSTDNNHLTADTIVLSDGTVIPYRDSNNLWAEATDYQTFAAYFAGRSFEYVIIHGIGSIEDLQKAGDLSGKIAVIPRGTLAFYDKAINAAELGAVGVIIVDNQPDSNATLEVRMDLSLSPIPAILVSGESGLSMEAAETKVFTLGETIEIKTRQTPMPSEFSARGTTPELTLKPDITAVGESVMCAAPDNGYTTINSTTASAATAAGMCACVKQRLMTEQPDLIPTELAKKTKALLVSSATLLLQSEDTTPYSPRIQGGGAADLDAALAADVILTSDGAHQVSLGDGFGSMVSFRVTAENLSDTAKDCVLDVIVGTDGYRSFTYSALEGEDTADGIAPLSERLGKRPSDSIAFIRDFKPFTKARVNYGTAQGQLNASSENFDPLTFTLKPHSSMTYIITIALNPAEYASCREIFTNGFFVEGFVRLTADDTAATLPFTGFSGDYYAADALDADIYAGEQAIYGGLWLYRPISDPRSAQIQYVLGSDPFRRLSYDSVPEDATLSFSPTADPNAAMIYLNFGLRRTITDVSVTVTDTSGEVVSHTEYGNIGRTYVSAITGMLTSTDLPLWNGRADDHAMYIYPDGEYRITVSYRRANSEPLESFTYDIILDSEKPTFSDAVFSVTDGTPNLTVEASDNYGVKKIFVSDSQETEAEQMEDGSFNLADLNGEFIYIELYDAALNSTIVRVKNPNYRESTFD